MALSWFIAPAILSIFVVYGTALSWKSCGHGADLIDLRELSVKPEILILPGPISVSGSAKLASNITRAIKMALTVRKKVPVVGYVKVPCEDGMGSCTYDDICKLSPYSESCPTVYDKFHVPCKCPVKQGSYKVKDFPFNVTGQFPKFLVKGKYKVNILLTDGGMELGCFDLQLSMI